MKILWITNFLLPEASSKLLGNKELRGSGGWLIGLANVLARRPGIRLIVAGITSLVNTLEVVEGELITYYAIPQCGNNSHYHGSYIEVISRVLKSVEPDVIHIHGTEYPFSLAALRACNPSHTAVSIQGLVSVIAPLYLGGLTNKEIKSSITLHDVLRPNLFQQQREMKMRGEYEVQLLRESTNVIGRTTWDRSHTWSVNHKAQYFHCDEVLRQEFYQGDVWCYDNCVAHSIFISQGYYPIKGLHILLDAIGLVKKHYPDVSLRIAGIDNTNSANTFWGKLSLSSYGKILRRRIRANSLENCIRFTGQLNALEMKREYLRSNVFVCPSCIENSPNSLGEAQVLGVPTLASYVGGIPDMMNSDTTNLYRFEDSVMLAYKICKIFSKGKCVSTDFIRKEALLRHNPDHNVDVLLDIYNCIQAI